MWLADKKINFIARKIPAAIVLAAFFVLSLPAEFVFAGRNLRPEIVEGKAVGMLERELYRADNDAVDTAGIRSAIANSAGIVLTNDRISGGSPIQMAEYLPPENRIRVLCFDLDGSRIELSDEMQVMQDNQRINFNNMVSRMYEILKAIGADNELNENDSAAVIRRFKQTALERIRRIMAPLARQYELDPQTRIILEWGSQRPASFIQKGPWEYEITLNIDLLRDENVLASELLREILRPLAGFWTTYLHLQEPSLFRAVNIKVKTGISKPVEEGFFANVWDWDFRKDSLALLMESIELIFNSSDTETKTESLKLRKALLGLADIGVDVLRESFKDEKLPEYIREIYYEIIIERAQYKDFAQHFDIDSIKADGIKTERLEDFLRRILTAIETFPYAHKKASVTKFKTALEKIRVDMLKVMENSEDRAVFKKGAEIKEITKARTLTAALAEVFIIEQQLKFLDKVKEEAIRGLNGQQEDQRKIFDKKGDFSALLNVEPDKRLEAIIDYIIKFKVFYSGRPELKAGARLLRNVLKRNPAVISKIFDTFEDNLKDMQVLPLRPPTDLSGVAALIDSYNVSLIEVMIVDPQGNLQGQRKSVLMPATPETLELLRKGIPFDGSSICSSRDGKTFGKIYKSDFIARVIPPTFRITRKRNGTCVAKIEAEAIQPLKNTLHPEFKIPAGLLARNLPVIDRQAEPVEAVKKGFEIIKGYGLNTVKCIINDWSEDPVIIEIAQEEFLKACEGGVELNERQARHLPTTQAKQGFRARPDPYSLRLIKYQDGTIEAVAAVEILDENKEVFAGDFRSLLKQLEAKLARKGIGAVMAPEPEFFLMRMLSDGTFVTADRSGYYDNSRSLPFDVQAVMEEILIAAETAGLDIRYIHHEVAPGQFEVPYKHDSPLESADKTTLYKYIVKRVAEKYGLYACFMPKPVKGINGNGMHVHFSLRALRELEIENKTYQPGDNLFYDADDPYRLSETARNCMGGVLNFALGFLRITNPSSNSYRRLDPGYEAPTALVAGDRNRSCAVRVPGFSASKEARFEYRVPDAAGNVYGKFYGIVSAAHEGILEEINPPDFVTEESVYKMSQRDKEKRGIRDLPGGTSGLKVSAALMRGPKHPCMKKFIDKLVGPKGSPVRDFLSQSIDLPVQSAAVGKSKAAAVASATGSNILVITDSLRANSNLIIKRILDKRNANYTFVGVGETEIDDIFRQAQKFDKIIICVYATDPWYAIRDKLCNNQPKAAAVLDLKDVPEYKWRERITSL